MRGASPAPAEPSSTVPGVTVLALKLFLAPAFIVGVSLVARRFGARAGGVVGGLPVIAGPILLVLALQHGRAFAADAANGTMLGVVALITFVVAYVAASRRASWPWALAAGWGTFFAVALLMREVHARDAYAFVLAAGACALGLAVLPRPAGEASPARPLSRWDLPLRALCTAVPVVAITGSAHWLGAHATGVLATFPIITPVAAAFTQAHGGAAESTRLLYGFTVGFFAYACFCLVISVGVTALGTAVAFLVAAAATLAIQAAAVLATAARPLEG
jgi:hypothetical protein